MKNLNVPIKGTYEQGSAHWDGYSMRVENRQGKEIYQNDCDNVDDFAQYVSAFMSIYSGFKWSEWPVRICKSKLAGSSGFSHRFDLYFQDPEARPYHPDRITASQRMVMNDRARQFPGAERLEDIAALAISFKV